MTRGEHSEDGRTTVVLMRDWRSMRARCGTSDAVVARCSTVGKCRSERSSVRSKGRSPTCTVPLGRVARRRSAAGSELPSTGGGGEGGSREGAGEAGLAMEFRPPPLPPWLKRQRDPRPLARPLPSRPNTGHAALTPRGRNHPRLTATIAYVGTTAIGDACAAS
jgi:hypothetical protein